ncbi:hypothetical protein Tco_0386062 [Tanacetum coccineum]
MDEQSHYKQDKTITRQSINVKRHIFNAIGGTEKVLKKGDLNIREIVSLNNIRKLNKNVIVSLRSNRSCYVIGYWLCRVSSGLDYKERYNADIRATNILLQGLPKDIYTLINHYTDAIDIWDNVKMLLEGSELTKEDRESQLMQLNSKFVNNMLPEWGRFVTAVKLNRGLRDSNYDQLYAYLKQHEAHANENKMILDRFTQHTIDPLALMSNALHQQYYSQSSTTPPSTYVLPHFADNSQLDSGLSPICSSNTRNQARVQDGRVVVQNVQGRQNRGQENNARGAGAAGYEGAQNRVGNANPGQARQIKCYNCNGGQDNVVDEDVDEQLVQDLALNVDNVFQADDCDAFDSNVDEAPTAQTMFMANLSSADPIIMKPVQVYMIQTINLRYQHETTIRMLFCEHHEVIRDLTMYNNYDDLLTADYMQEQVELYERWAKFELTEREQKIDEQLRIVITDHMFYIATNSELTVSRFTEMHDAHTVVQARCLELEAELSKLCDKVQKDDHTELVKRFSNLEVNHLNLQLKYQNLKERFGNSTSPPPRHVPDFDSVFVIEKVKASIQGKDNTIKKLRMQITQLKETRSETDRTLDFRALDFQITQLTDNVTVLQEQNEFFRTENAKVKQHYKELYDSIKITRTLCEIVEEARVEKPFDSLLASACLYTKHSQELLEYVISTYSKDFNKRDRKIATAPFNKKKLVTFMEPGVKDATAASGSKPRNNTKKDRTLLAKSDKKKVEHHSRNNTSSVKQKNRVDSSISYKRTVINSNSNYVCKTCNKCLMSFNHDKCVVKSLKFVKKPPVNKVWRVKPVKQVWQATGKLFTNVGFQWQPTGRKFTLGEQCPLTRFTESKVVPVKR